MTAETSAGELASSVDTRKVLSSITVGADVKVQVTKAEQAHIDALVADWVANGKEAQFAAKLRAYGKERGWAAEKVDVMYRLSWSKRKYRLTKAANSTIRSSDDLLL